MQILSKILDAGLVLVTVFLQYSLVLSCVSKSSQEAHALLESALLSVLINLIYPKGIYTTIFNKLQRKGSCYIIKLFFSAVHLQLLKVTHFKVLLLLQ